MKKGQHSKKRDVIFVVALVTLIAGGLWLFGEKHHSDNLYGWNRKLPVAASSDINRQLVKKFEFALNEFLQDIRRRMGEYKRQRALLDDLVKPRNLSDAPAIKGNYELSRTLIPQLRADINGLMQAFETQEREVQALSSGQPSSIRGRVEETWARMKEKHLRTYVAYFTLEDEILSAHEDLLTLYYRKTNSLRFDPQTNQILFNDPADKQKEQALRHKIGALLKEQAETLK